MGEHDPLITHNPRDLIEIREMRFRAGIAAENKPFQFLRTCAQCTNNVLDVTVREFLHDMGTVSVTSYLAVDNEHPQVWHSV